jgi:hypothetical protein
MHWKLFAESVFACVLLIFFAYIALEPLPTVGCGLTIIGVLVLVIGFWLAYMSE